MGKPHLDLFALAARLPEGFCISQRTDAVPDIFIEVSRDFADDRRGRIVVCRWFTNAYVHMLESEDFARAAGSCCVNPGAP